MSLNFPENPNDQDVYEGFIFDASLGVWNRKIEFGPTGPTGPTGPQGDIGPTGPKKLDSIDEISEQTASSYTLTINDANELIRANNSVGVTVIIPENSSVSFPLKTEIHFIQYGVGPITFEPFSETVVIRSTPGLVTRDRWSMATLIKIDNNEWVLTGDISE